MSETKLATKADLKEMYDRILPYLGGSADAGFTPVGTVISVMSNHAPANYLICDGTVYNIADYPELANHFLNEFGSKNHFGGDGTTTFAVPSLQGEFLRGAGTNSHSGQGNGSAVGVHQNATELLNWFYNSYKNLCISYNKYVSNVDSAVDSDWCYYESRNLYVSDNTKLGKFTSRPTNTSVLYCIATKNIYLNPSNDYSTDEKVVGTWIDGKPIYQKTIVYTTSITLDTWIWISVDALVDNYISCDVLLKTNGQMKNLNSATLATSSISSTSTSGKGAVSSAHTNTANPQNQIGVYVGVDAWISGFEAIYITIQYTKTTS